MPVGNSSVISTGAKSSPIFLLISTDSTEKGSGSHPAASSKIVIVIRTGSINLARISTLSSSL